MDVPNFDILSPTAGQESGIFKSLDPSYQAQQLQNQAAQLALKRATAFQNGVPTTDGTPNGPVDIDAIARNQIQNGDASGGLGLMMSGLKLKMLADPSTVSNPTGQGGGASGGGAGPLAGPAPQGGAGSGSSPAGGTGGLDPLSVYAHSIGALESNNQYDALGQKQTGGDRAYGRYQVMGANIPSWTKEVLGQSMSPADFLASPQAQDAVFRAKFGQSVQQYGNPMDAASVWFSGKPLARAGNATDSLGTSVPAYIQRFAAGLNPAIQALRGGQSGGGQPPAPGQAAAVPAPTGVQAQPISFGGPGASPSPVTGGPAAPSDSVASATPGTSGAAIGDAQVMQARKTIQAMSGYASESLSPGARQALAAAQGVVSQYLTQQNTPSGTADGAPNSTPDEAPKSGQHPFAPGGTGIKSPPIAPTSAHGMSLAATNGQAPGGAMPVSFGGAPGGAPPVMPQGQPMPSPGRQPPQVGSLTGAASGGAPAMPAGAPAGGFQPVSFGGAPQGQGQGAPAPAAPASGGVPPIPPEVGAALQRLQSRQGSPADAALWGNYQRSVAQGMAGALAPGGGVPGGAGPVRPTIPGVQGGAPSSPYGAPPPSSSGPDLPYLQGKYATPGGGAQYVADMLDTARRYGLAGEQQAAQAFIERAKQVQSDLQEVNKSRLDLQTKNAELTPEQKLFQTAQGQGFTGSYIDFQNTLAAGKANANATGRNATLTPGEKEYNQAVAGGFQGSEADYQAAAASEKAEQEGQGRYLGGLPQQYAASADAGRVANDNLDQMLTAAKGFSMGAGADTVQTARKALQTGLGLIGVSGSAINDPTASLEDFNKLAGAHLRSVVSGIAGPKGVQELELVGSSLPSAEMSYDGFRAVSSSLKGSNDYAIAKQQASQDWLADPTHSNSLKGFEASFNRNVTPSAFWLNRLRVDQPDLFTQAVQRLGQTDQGRALLTKAKAGMGYAQKQGLF